MRYRVLEVETADGITKYYSQAKSFLFWKYIYEDKREYSSYYKLVPYPCSATYNYDEAEKIIQGYKERESRLKRYREESKTVRTKTYEV